MRRYMRSILPAVMLVSILCLLSACNPLTRDYQPMSKIEKKVFEVADRNIFPDDIRKAPADYQDTMVAWTGIVVQRKFVKQEDHTEAQFVLKHHYYDWVENPGFEDERILLSPRGEGTFKTSWRIKTKGRFKKIKKSSPKGSLLIVYGRPTVVNEDGTVVLASKHLRAFNKKYFSTGMIDYGRPEKHKEEAEPQEVAEILEEAEP